MQVDRNSSSGRAPGGRMQEAPDSDGSRKAAAVAAAAPITTVFFRNVRRVHDIASLPIDG
jgi:hypothetical protein